MGRFLQWTRIQELLLLPEYFSTLARHWQDILWGASVPAVTLIIRAYLGHPPKLAVAAFLVLAMFMAGYYMCGVPTTLGYFPS